MARTNSIDPAACHALITWHSISISGSSIPATKSRDEHPALTAFLLSRTLLKAAGALHQQPAVGERQRRQRTHAPAAMSSAELQEEAKHSRKEEHALSAAGHHEWQG
jgi:hypothetical protein